MAKKPSVELSSKERGKRVERLAAIALPKLKKPGLHPDGNGLYFQITPNGSRSWLLRYMLRRKRRGMGLGPYPMIPLGEARQMATEAKRLIAKGIDPIDARAKEKAEARAAAASSITFAACAEAYINAHEKSWRNGKHRQQWRNTLKEYAEPVFKDTPVSEITTDLVMKVLEPEWTKKTETLKRVRGRLEAVLDWARVRGYRTGENPARWKGHLNNLLPAPNKVMNRKHQPALPFAKMKPFMKALEKVPGLTAECLKFTILTAGRSGETRGAVWDEINLKERLWTVPANRMKGGRPHSVALSKAAVALLEERAKLKNGPYVFPGGKDGQPLSDMAMTSLLRRMKFGHITTHGFRSSFQDWRAEETNYTGEEGEMALAHKISDKVEEAYRRGDLFKKRLKMMDDWAAHCGV